MGVVYDDPEHANAVACTSRGVKNIPEDVAPLFTPLKMGRYELTNRMVCGVSRISATGAGWHGPGADVCMPYLMACLHMARVHCEPPVHLPHV